MIRYSAGVCITYNVLLNNGHTFDEARVTELGAAIVKLTEGAIPWKQRPHSERGQVFTLTSATATKEDKLVVIELRAEDAVTAAEFPAFVERMHQLARAACPFADGIVSPQRVEFTLTAKDLIGVDE